MPQPYVNTLNCLILESKVSLRQIPAGVFHYFVNSKRRFFVYFRHLDQMMQTMRILSSRNIKFYRRESLLPDRQELQQLVYHCNYKIKKQDLRKNLYHSTPYNEPRVYFDKYQKIKQNQQSVSQDSQNVGPNPPDLKKTEEKQIPIEDKPPQDEKKAEVQALQFKNPEVLEILANKELLANIFSVLNVGL